MIERIILFTDPVFKHLFAELRVVAVGSAHLVNSIDLMVAHGIVNGHFQVVDGAQVQIIQGIRTSPCFPECVHDQIAAGDHKIRIDVVQGIDGLKCTFHGFAFGLKVKVGDEGKGESVSGMILFFLRFLCTTHPKQKAEENQGR